MSAKVHYFPAYGRAEAIRFLLAHANVPLENVDYTREAFQAAKESGTFEFGQLPLLEIDGKIYAQSCSILRFLGLKYGYYPADPYAGWKVDSTMDALNDTLNAFYKSAFASETEKPALYKVFLEEQLPKFFAAMQKRLLENSSQKYIVGDKATIADFHLVAFADNRLFNPLSPVIKDMLPIAEQFPELFEYFKRFREEELAEYLAGRRASSM